MAKFIMVYKSADPYDITLLPEKEIQKISETWGEWLGSFGNKLVDRGQQFKFGGKSLGKEGAEDSDNTLAGFSIIEADSIDEALDMAKGSPIIQIGGKVEVYQVFAD